MSAKHLTPVFPPETLPVRAGAYLTRSLDTVTGKVLSGWGYSYFDATDRIWGCTHERVDQALRVPDYEFAHQHKEWRGLTEEFK